MNNAGAALARAARDLVGCRFRLHGRDPATGLDCVGVLAASLAGIGQPRMLPNGYSLRTGRLPELAGVAARCGFQNAGGPPQPGDVALVRVGACQYHVLVAVSDRSFVHAHAGLKRVVLHHGPLEWPLLGHWRLDSAA